MKTRHCFLTGALVNVPARWYQAFPEGIALPGPPLPPHEPPSPDNPASAGVTVVWVPVAHTNWMEWLLQLSREAPACHPVVLSAMPEDQEALLALQAGAKGYVHLHSAPSLFREVAVVVEHGGLWPGAGLVARFLAATTNLLQRSETAGRGDISMLSARESQVAKAVAAGLSNKEVASRLNISERTVKAHLGAVFEKLEVRDRLQLALFLSAGARTPRKAGAEGGDA